MVSVITGDVVNSRDVSPPQWQSLLKRILRQYGREPRDWELYRGDSFQLLLPAADALRAALHLKAGMRQFESLDVRTGIGTGTIDYRANRITASSGTAFVRSGNCFDRMKKQTLCIETGKSDLDEEFNLVFSLLNFPMSKWSPAVAKVITAMIENPLTSQQDIARKLKISQSTCSEALKRGGYEELKNTVIYYRKKMKKHVGSDC